MAKMSYTEWLQQKKEGAAAPSQPAAPSNTSDSGSANIYVSGSSSSSNSSSKPSYSDWLNERRNREATESIEGWINQTNQTLTGINSYLSTWRSANDPQYEVYLRQLSNQLAQANNWRNQYAGNEEAISVINEAVQYLSDARQFLGQRRDYYSNWNNETEYQTGLRHYGYQQKYAGMSYTELENILGELEDGEEKEWLSQYAPTVMTDTDYGVRIGQLNTDIYILENSIEEMTARRDELQRLNAGYSRSYTISQEQKDAVAEELAQLNAEIESAQAQLDSMNASRWELTNGRKYNLIDDRPDFNTGSVVAADGKTAGFGIGIGNSWWGNGDPVYDYINDLDGTRQQHMTATAMKGGSPYSIYDLMRDEEINIYNYLYNTEGRDSAQEYLGYLEYTLNERRMGVTQANAIFLANTNPLLASAVSVPINLMSGIGTLDVAGQNIIKGLEEDFTGEYAGPVDYNRAAMAPTVTSSTIRATRAEHYADKYGSINLDPEAHPILSQVLNGKSLGDVYQLGMSMVDSAAVAALSPVIGSAGTVLLGGSASSQAILDAVENGATDEQALTMGILSGAFEILFEKYELDHLLGADSNVVKALVNQALTEGIGEGATTIANSVADFIVMAENSGYQRLVAEYIENGLSPEEAARQALLDYAIQVGWDVVGGMLSGSIMGAAASPIENMANRNAEAQRIYGSDPGALVSEALEINPENAFAQRMQGRLDNGKNLSGGQLNRLVQQNEKALSAQDMRLIQEAAAQRLTELGETSNVESVAAALARQAAGNKLSKADRQIIADSKYGNRVSNELNTENIRSGDYASAWTQRIGTERINARDYNKELMDLAIETAGATASRMNQAAPGQENKSSEGNLPGGEKAVSYESSEDGKAHLISDPQKDISIKGIASVEKGSMKLALSDGSTVDASDVSFGSEDEAIVYAAVAGMGVSVDTANALVNAFDPGKGVSAAMYALDIREAYNFGRYNYTAKAAENDPYASVKKQAWNDGRIAEIKSSRRDQVNINTAAREAKQTLQQTGKAVRGDHHAVLDDGIDYMDLSETQKASYQLADQVAQAAKVNIRVYNGKGIEHGYYSPKHDAVFLNINAINKDGKSLMAFTLGHELVHRAKKGSPAKYQAFADFLMEQYGKQGSDIEDMIGEQLQAAKDNDIKMTRDKAFDEVVADACQRMLLDTDAGKKLARFGAESQRNKSIVGEIRRWIREFMDKLRKLFQGVEPGSYAAREFAKFDETVKQILADMYVDMTIDAGEHLSTIRAAFGKDTEVKANEAGEFTMAQSADGSEKIFNLVTWKNGGRETLKATLLREGYTEEEVNAALTIMDGKQKLVEDIASELNESGAMAFPEQGRINEATLTTDIKDGHSVLSALVSNGDYPVNIDLLMVCKKRKAYQRVINRLCETGLIQRATVDALAIAEINKILGKYGFETACLGCFVESRRLLIQEWAQTIVKEWNGEVKKRNPKAKPFGFGKGEAKLDADEIMQLIGELESGGPKNDKGNLNLGQGSAVKRMGVLLDKVPSLARTLSIEDLITPDGLSALRRFDSNLFSMVKSRYGSNSPKFVQEFNPYNHELAMYGKVPQQYNSLREYLYAIGGARMQSFSDFIVENWFDYCQIVADLAARKLPMHTYTKEIALARLFGMTGIKINMSLIPDIDRSLGKEYAGLTRNAKGELELIWADKDRFKATGGKSYMQSINFADAIALQEDPRYSANVGTIAVGISDRHIRMMLNDSRIRMVIPYHASGMNPIFADLMGTSYYKDYTNFQNTTVKQMYDSKGNPVKVKLTKPQTAQLTGGFQFNAVLQELGDARAAADAYKEWCADASLHTITIKGETYTAELTPKFNDFADETNYYKLLEDFNPYDCITEQAAPQGDVQQIYPEGFEDILKAELRGQERYRQKQEKNQAFDKAMGEIERYLETHSKADTVHYANQHGINLGAKDKKLDAAGKARLKQLQQEGASFKLPMVEAALPTEEQMMHNIRDVAYMDSVLDIDASKMEDSGKDPKQLFYDLFNSLGGSIRSDIFGEIKLNKASINSDYGHGKTAAKIASIEAIPSVIHNGKVINWFEKNNNVYRITVAAPIKIGKDTYYMGVMLLRDSNTQRLYLHDVVIEKEVSDLLTGYPSTLGTDKRKKNLSISSLLDEILFVKDKERFNEKYMNAVKQGDMTTAQWLVNVAARISGYIPVIRYHQTASKFTKFSTDNPVAGLNDSETPNGIFFKTNDHDIGIGGNIQMQLYLRVGNSLHFADRKEANAWYCENVPGYDALQKELEKALKPYLDQIDAITEQEWDENKTDEEIDALFEEEDKVIKAMGKVEDSYRARLRELLNEYFLSDKCEYDSIELDYDGHRWVNGKREDVHTFIVFRPSQAKSAAPVTYDDNGNVIPLHYRFSRSRSDIRYKLPVGEDTSPRALLANAFEGVAQGDIEKRNLKQYQENVERLNTEEAKLRELKAEIKELSFAKGPRDKKRISELRFEAMHTENRIATLDKMLLRFEGSAPLQNILQREKDMVRQRERKKAKDALAEYRKEEKAKNEEWQREVREKYQDSRRKVIETRDKRDATDKLMKLVLDTVKWISYPSKTDVKCPDILKKPYADFLNGIDLSSKRLASGGDPTQNDLRLANAMGSLATALERIGMAQDPTSDTGTPLDSGYLDLPAGFVQKLRDMIEKINDMMEVGDFVINSMTADEVKQLSQMIRTLNHAIKEMSTLYANLRFANVEALGDDSMTFMDDLGEIEKTSGMRDFVEWENALPYYAFKRFGNGGESVFEGLMNAQDKLAFLAQEIFGFRDKTWTDKEAKAWSEDTHTIDLPSGRKLTLTTADAMSIYCLSRRKQGLQHLLGGGVRVVGLQKGSRKAKDSRSVLSIQDIDAINSSLTDRQRKVAENIQEFMSTVCSEWGNEISMKRFLTREFTEKHYFPIESNDENLPTKDPSAQQSDLFRLLNISATKPIDPRANNEVIVRNIFDVFTGHASDMARLNAFGMPLLDYMKWLNYREKTANEEGQIKVRGVRKSMETAYGNAAKSYVLNLIKDVNGRPSDGGLPSFYTRMLKNAKTAMVGSSLRVATLQITSYPRAALVLSPRSLALGLTKKPNIEKAKKYCGIALWKSFGFYDTNISRSIEDQMKGVTDVRQKLIELSLKGAEVGDALTWGVLWSACEYEVAATNKYQVGSEEFNQAVGKKLREVVYATQVVDSTLTRSQFMRSKNSKAQEVSSFMSEPTLSANILMDAALQFNMENRRSGSAKAAWKKTGGYVAKAVAVYSIGQIAAALLEGLWDAWRDDEDEKFGEKFIDSFVENLVLDLLPFNKIPIISDMVEAVLSLFDLGFFSSESLYSTGLAQMVSAVDAWRDVLGGKSSATAYNALYKTVRAISSFYGVAFGGVMREGVALWNNTAGAYDSTWKIRTYEPSKAEKAGLLLDALIEGDDRKAESLRAEFADEKAIQSGVRSAIRERFLSGEIDVSTALKYLVLYGGMDAGDARWDVEEWAFEKENEGAEFGKYNEFYEAVRTGENLDAVIDKYTDNGVRLTDLRSQITSHFKDEYLDMTEAERDEIRDLIIDAYVACGVTREDAEYDLDCWDFEAENGFAYSDRKTAYINGEITAEQLRKALIDFGGYSQEDADTQIQVYDWNAQGYDNATMSNVRKYNEFCQAAGVDVATYLHIMEFANNTENATDPDTGEKIPYSAVKKIMEEINRLNLSDAQKTAIALSLWKESTVNKYKLW